MTEERQPNTELREKAKQWLLSNYPGRNYEQDVVAVKDMADFAASIQEEFEHEFDERTKLIGKLREADKQLAEARIELEAAEQRGDEYKAAWAEALAERDELAAQVNHDCAFHDELALTSEIHNRFCGENGEPCQVCRLKAEREGKK